MSRPKTGTKKLPLSLVWGADTGPLHCAPSRKWSCGLTQAPSPGKQLEPPGRDRKSLPFRLPFDVAPGPLSGWLGPGKQSFPVFLPGGMSAVLMPIPAGHRWCGGTRDVGGASGPVRWPVVGKGGGCRAYSPRGQRWTSKGGEGPLVPQTCSPAGFDTRTRAGLARPAWANGGDRRCWTWRTGPGCLRVRFSSGC